MWIDKVLQAKECGDIFTNDKSTAKHEYLEIAKAIHPDVCCDSCADEAMLRLNELYAQAQEHFRAGTWSQEHRIVFKDKSGKRISVSFVHRQAFELGERLIATTAVVYLFDKDKHKYFANMVERVSHIRYANDAMRKTMHQVMPRIIRSGEIEDGRYYAIIEKPVEAIPMDLFLTKKGSGLDTKHAAWMISRLSNLCCFFSYNKIAFNGLSLHSLFIDPVNHTVLPLGGWWYATPIGQKLIGMNKEVFDRMSVKDKSEKKSSIVTDLECVKYIGRQLCASASTPDAIKRFLQSGSSDDAVYEFHKWDDAIIKAYGKREFVKLDVNPDEIYQ